MQQGERIMGAIAWVALTAVITFIAALISVIAVDYFNVDPNHRDPINLLVIATTIIGSSIWYWG